MAPKDFYAVHKGRETGLFYSWSECERQIKCYPGQSYKGFSYGEEEQARYFVKHGYEMGPPTKWCPVDTSTKSSGIYTSWIHAQEAIKNVSNASYRSLSSLDAAKLFLINRGSTPLKSKSLNRHSFRNTTTSNQSRGSLLTTNFNALRYPKIGNLVQKNTARSSPLTPIERSSREYDRKLRGFQALCKEVRQKPCDTIQECAEVFRGTLVNIVDLLDARRLGRPAKVWTNFAEFKRYTMQPGKCVHLETAREDQFISSLLQNLSDPAQFHRREALRESHSRANGTFSDNQVINGRVEKPQHANEKRYADQRAAEYLRATQGQAESARAEAEIIRARKQVEIDHARRKINLDRAMKKAQVEQARQMAELERAKQEAEAVRARICAEIHAAKQKMHFERARKEEEVERARREAEVEHARHEAAELRRAREAEVVKVEAELDLNEEVVFVSARELRPRRAKQKDSVPAEEAKHVGAKVAKRGRVGRPRKPKAVCASQDIRQFFSSPMGIKIERRA